MGTQKSWDILSGDLVFFGFCGFFSVELLALSSLVLADCSALILYESLLYRIVSSVLQ